MTKPDAGASIADEDNCDPMNYRSRKHQGNPLYFGLI